MARSRKTADGQPRRDLPPDQRLAPAGVSQDRALHLWARYEALPSYGLPDDVVAAAGEAITARGALDRKTTCTDDRGQSVLAVPKMIDALERLAASDGWQGLRVTQRAAVDTLLENVMVWPRLRLVTIGAARRDGTWQQPIAPDTDDGPRTLADVSAEPVAAVAAGLFYRGRLGLIHGPSFSGKSTMIANAVARIVTGRPWLNQPTIQGSVIMVVEEPDTYRPVVERAGTDPATVLISTWRGLARDVRQYQPVAVVVDTMQRIAHELGGLDLNQPGETDSILRPLETIARKHGTAVVVTDHEPHDEKGTGTKGRPRGSTAKGATADYVLRCTRDEGAGITRVQPDRGSARYGIAVFAFAVTADGKPTIDRPAEVPPAVTGAAGAAPAPADDQPFGAVLADLSVHMRRDWLEKEPAIRAMLTTNAKATDRTIAKATGLPVGGRNLKYVNPYIAAIRDAMLTGSAGASESPPTSPPQTAGSTLPDCASGTASAPIPVDRKHSGSTLPDRASRASGTYKGSTIGKHHREAPSGASGSGEPEASGSDDGDPDQDAAPVESDQTTAPPPPTSTDQDAAAPVEKIDAVPPLPSTENPGAGNPPAEKSTAPPPVDTAADPMAALPDDPPGYNDGAVADRLAAIADVLTGAGESDPAAAPESNMPAMRERLRAFYAEHDISPDDLSQSVLEDIARDRAESALAELRQHGDVDVRIAARRIVH